jgi:multicomponent Na+:H+ antiporter subunit F
MILVQISLTLLAAAAVLVLFQIVRGPSLADRVVTLDFFTVVAVAFIAVYSVATGQPTYLNVAITLALVAFLATVGYAFFIARRGKP